MPRILARLPAWAVLVALPLAAGACQNVSSPRQMYAASMTDLTSNDGSGGLNQKVRARMQSRYEQVISMYNAGEITEPEDVFWASALLVKSWDQEHLVLAQALAQRAAQEGEERGYVILAEATDKQLLNAGQPQRYGTQIVYVTVLKEWRLYDTDPQTTDEERASMGIPPLEELVRLVQVQNDSALAQKLRATEEPEEKPEFLRRPGE